MRASSADEALLHLLREDFAAIVLDIRMPDMNGIELASLIKQRKRSQHVPILFLTAHLVEGRRCPARIRCRRPSTTSANRSTRRFLRSKVGVFIELFRKTHELAALNARLQEEIVERKSAQRALLDANRDLERRVQDRTAALARAHQQAREDEERWRMAMEVAHIAAWEVESGVRTDDVVDRTRRRCSAFRTALSGRSCALRRCCTRTTKCPRKARLPRRRAAVRTRPSTRAVRPDGSIVWITERGTG